VIVDDLPAGSSLLFRHLHLLPGGSVFTQSFQRELRLWNLSDRMSNRPEIYDTAYAMARDYPWWGGGAGSFVALFQLYMKPGQEWAAYLHNDWLEFRITLGFVGLTLLVLSLVTLMARSWSGPGIPSPSIVPALLWLALAGCLAHARFDFPFQVYSVAFLFILITAIASSLSFRTR
jgi:O-antigen ligase